MKVVCDCGNECLFDTIDEDTGLETEFLDDEGQYARKDGDFGFWTGHDVVGIVCDRCEKAIWIFV